MKKLLLLFVVIVVSSGVHAQPTPHAFWEAQHPLPQGNTMRSVQMFDSASYIMCGDVGTIVFTTDNGDTWKVQAKIVGFDKALNGLAFNTRAHGVTVGTGGGIFHTSDSGRTWKKATSPNTNTLNGVAYATANVVVAVGLGGTIVRSLDSGKTWKLVALESNYHIRSVKFVSADSGFAVGVNGFMYVTSDSGATWTIRTFPFNNNFFDVSFHGNHREVALAAELGGIFLSHDGGVNFTQQKNVSPWGNVNAIWQLSPTTVIAACDYRAIYVTTNSGADWRNVLPFGSGYDHLKALSFSDQKQGVAVGVGGVILRTYDGGMTWQAAFDRIAIDKNVLYGIAAIDNNTVVSCGGEGLIAKSTNGGKTWRNIPSPTYQSLRAVQFSTPKVGTIVGDSGLVLRTQNGGESWYRLPTFTRSTLNAVNFLDTAIGMAVGEGGTILRTQTGGRVWNQIHYNDTALFFGVSFNTPTSVVIAGMHYFDYPDGGIGITPMLSVSDDGGFTFVEAKHNVGGRGAGIRSISFPTPNIGYAGIVMETSGAAVGKVAKTTDGGHTWTITGNLPAEIKAISFARPGFGTAVGVKGNTWHTSTGGETWVTTESNTSLDLYAVSHSSLKFAWACGQKTLIIRETTDDVEQSGAVGSPSPSVRLAEMLSNYPNPLGAGGTTFNLKLPEASHITLRMYSATGAEIEKIYDGFFPEGEHTIDWLPKDLAAGIYFTLLKACGKREMVKVVVE